MSADLNPDELNKQYNSYIGGAIWWNISEDANQASTVVPRLLEAADAEEIRQKPESIHAWLSNWIDANGVNVQAAMDSGLKSCMGVNSTDGSKFPTIVGVVNCKTKVNLPKPLLHAAPVAKVFLRIAEVGATLFFLFEFFV